MASRTRRETAFSRLFTHGRQTSTTIVHAHLTHPRRIKDALVLCLLRLAKYWLK
jgi:hypothetical protein